MPVEETLPTKILPTGKFFLGQIVSGKFSDKKFAMEFVPKELWEGILSFGNLPVGKTIHTKFAHGKIFLLGKFFF